MKKIREVFDTMYQAILFSFSFCWRNSKSGTIIRIVTTIALAIFGYIKIRSTGYVLSALQNEYALGTKVQSFYQSETFFALILIGTIIGAGIVLERVNWYYRSKWNQKLSFDNTREINAHKASLDIASYKSEKYDDLAKQIEELPNSWRTRMAFAQDMLGLGSTTATFIIFGVSIFWYSPVYGTVIFLTALPMMVSEFQVVSMWWNLFKELVPHNKKRGVLQKAYTGPLSFTQLLMFNQHSSLRKLIDESRDSVIEKYDYIRLFSVRRELFVHVVAAGGLLAVITHAVWSMWTHHGDLGQLVVLIASTYAFQGSLEGVVSTLADQWNNAKGVILIEKEYFGLKPMIQTKNRVIPEFTRPPGLVLDNVSFAYPGSDSLALKNITLKVESGKSLAIVGRSGSGKTTLQSLMLRHYDPTSGKIIADGVNLRNIDPQDWTSIASSLTQKFAVMERLVADEIASSDLSKETDMEIVADASRFAGFDEVIADESKGYQTQIGTDFGGKEFSGGEERRLALARVRYRQTPVLILDEPDSGLDPETAQKVMENVFALKGVTLVVITHHVSRAERCDHIVMLEKGEIAEQGTHQELMARNGKYYSMFNKDKERLSI